MHDDDVAKNNQQKLTYFVKLHVSFPNAKIYIGGSSLGIKDMSSWKVWAGNTNDFVSAY